MLAAKRLFGKGPPASLVAAAMMSNMTPRPPQPDHDPGLVAEQDVQGEAARSRVSAVAKRTILPTDLSAALTNLPENELQRLAKALAVELQRRGTIAASAAGAARRPDSLKPPRHNQASAGKRPDGVADLPLAKGNAVRAAIKSGVKPTVVARQLGVNLSAIRRALGKDQ